VYELPEQYNHALKRSQRRCIDDQYGTEIRIHEELLKSPIRTLDGDEVRLAPASLFTPPSAICDEGRRSIALPFARQAEFYFVPIYGECMLFKELKMCVRSWAGPLSHTSSVM
jgi:hypothetical protein